MNRKNLLLTTVCISAFVLTACNSSNSSNGSSGSDDVGDFSRNLTMDLSDTSSQELLDDATAYDFGSEIALSIAQGDTSADDITIRSLNRSSQYLFKKIARETISGDVTQACDSGSVDISISGDISDTSGNVSTSYSADNCRYSGSSDSYTYDTLFDADLDSTVSWETSDTAFTSFSSSSSGNMEMAYAVDGESGGSTFAFGFLYDLSDLDSSVELSGDYFLVNSDYSLYMEVYTESDGSTTRVGGSMSVDTLETIYYEAPTTTGSIDHPIDGKVQITVGSTTATIEFFTAYYEVTVGSSTEVYSYDYEDTDY